MRLWTIHPRHLDTKGLVAAWREGLLAQKVLAGRTKGYRNHPQLVRFRKSPSPLESIGAFLFVIWQEAKARKYRFDADKIRFPSPRLRSRIRTTKGQITYEWLLLGSKLRKRDRTKLAELVRLRAPEPSPVFRIVPGGIEPWERVIPRFLRLTQPARMGHSRSRRFPEIDKKARS